MNSQRTSFQAGHIQQVAYQPVEPVGFLTASLDQPAPDFFVHHRAFLQAAQRAGDRNQRSA